MELRWVVQFGAALLVGGVILSMTAVPAAATAETDPANFEYHAVDLIEDGSQQISGNTATLVLNGTASEGDVIEIAIDEDERDAFNITDATAGSDDIGISVGQTAETIEVTLTDLGGDGDVSGVEITVTVDLRASDAIVGGSKTHNETTVGTVVGDPTGSGLVGESVVTASVAEAAEIGFTAEEIDDSLTTSGGDVRYYDQFALSFTGNDVTATDGEKINITVDPDAITAGDEDGIELQTAAKYATHGNNITDISVSTSDKADVLDGSADQITVTISTANEEPRLISEETIVLTVEIRINEKSMRSAANRYHRADFFEVDVEGENNTELTDNGDVRTESPLFLDIYPNEVETFALGNITSGSEVGITDGQVVGIETIEDEFGNEIREPTIETTLVGAEDSYTDSGITIDTADRDGLELGRDGEIDPPVGVFDLTVEITDIEGPKTHTAGAVTATVEDVVVYPDDVDLEVVGPANDFDADGGKAELAVDLGVPDDEIDRLDLELRRTAGNGTVTLNGSAGGPTATNLWTDTEYAGDGELRPENVWAIERDLTAEDFDGDGVRTYILETNTTGRYEIAVDVMPYEGRLVANETEVNSSTVEEHGNSTRGTADIVATGPIEAVTNVTVGTDHEFVGTEADPGGDIVVDLGTFLDTNGNRVSKTDETVTVGLGNETIETGVGAGSVTTDVGPTAERPSATVELDPTEINTTAIETGRNATVAIAFEDSRQHNTTNITLLHRVIEPNGSTWQTGSVPQPATLYVDADGARDLTRWNATAERYESFADGTDDVLDHQQLGAKHLHSGFYFRSDDEEARLGYEFVTGDEAMTDDDRSESVELGAGWHLESSNYDVSTHSERGLAADVNWTGYGFGGDDDAFVVRNSTDARLHDRTNGSDIDGATTAIGHDETYWIRIIEDSETPLAREVVSPAFSEADGLQKSGGS